MRRDESSWDAYAPFYDWENARTLGRRDVGFWQRLVGRVRGPVLELGCGTGRLLVPVSRSGRLVGIDRSTAMLARARRRIRRLRRVGPALVRGDVRRLPFPARRFAAVMAPYGLLQSLLSDRDLSATLREAARVLRPGGRLAIDLVPDLPRWTEYRRQVRLRGRLGGARLTLVESVRQDRRRGLTIFDEQFTARERGRTRRRRFSLTFRTVSMKRMLDRVARAGFDVEAVLGDYRGRPWDPRADVWVILARKC